MPWKAPWDILKDRKAAREARRLREAEAAQRLQNLEKLGYRRLREDVHKAGLHEIERLHPGRTEREELVHRCVYGILPKIDCTFLCGVPLWSELFQREVIDQYYQYVAILMPPAPTYVDVIEQFKRLYKAKWIALTSGNEELRGNALKYFFNPPAPPDIYSAPPRPEEVVRARTPLRQWEASVEGSDESRLEAIYESKLENHQQFYQWRKLYPAIEGEIMSCPNFDAFRAYRRRFCAEHNIPYQEMNPITYPAIPFRP